MELDKQDEKTLPDDLEAKNGELIIPAPGRTLLPNPIAQAVSLATRSTGFALKVGTAIGGFGFGAAKVTTLSSLEVGRSILEGIISRAGRDVIARSNSDLARQDAETVLERSLENLHYTMTQVVFWTSTGFRLTEDALYHITDMSRLTLNFLDSFLGSTESSRAIASIITLIRREFNNPATGQPGEKVGVVDLLLGLTGLALIQGWAWRLIEEENRRLGVEEVIWDVVVLSDGQRVDVHEDSLYGVHSGAYQSEDGMHSSVTSSNVVGMIQRHGIIDDPEDDDGLPEIRLKRQLMQTLPADAKVSISTETSITKTITVDVAGTQPRRLLPPPGVELVEQTELKSPDQRPGQASSALGTDATPLPVYRVVYRINKNSLRSTDVERGPEDQDVPRFVEQIDDTDEDTAVDADVAVLDDDLEELPPPLPPKELSKPKATTIASFVPIVIKQYR
ncbi:putative lipase protein [Phaeoacremonium minimum UCRPA7]|uniref:Putative lipase protein n=1 Tax=Phaeoacremonium minimum (strain UCR-PA7) TaxID=1286976 RepID=R8BCM3_PHAM7|nr:putative lipase protein [Phaeoacremonium minimum UCRPA7]EON97037.1 putative lipase protein [Phaeoacremonium minimum UCRPA7]